MKKAEMLEGSREKVVGERKGEKRSVKNAEM